MKKPWLGFAAAVGVIGMFSAAPAAHAQFNINIVAGPDALTSSVSATGTDTHATTDSERTQFQIDDANLKGAVNLVHGNYHCKEPESVELNGSEHNQFGWTSSNPNPNARPLTTTVTVEKAEVLGITATPTIISKQYFGPSDKDATYTASIHQDESTTTETNWSSSSTIGVEQKFTYSVKVGGTGVGGETALSYSTSWGEGGSQSSNTTVGSSSDVQIPLKKGEEVVAQLTANRGTMSVRITYLVTLNGCIASHYSPKCGGHYYYCDGIGSVLAAKSLPTSYEVTENIAVGYYSDAQVTVKDVQTGEIKASFTPHH